MRDETNVTDRATPVKVAGTLPFSGRRCYVAQKIEQNGLKFEKLPSGTVYHRRPDGSLVKAVVRQA